MIGDTLFKKLEEQAEAAAWVPLSQQEGGEDVWRTLFLVVHTKTDPLGMMAGIRQQIAKVDQDLALTDIRTMEGRLDESVWRQRLAATAMGALSLAALVIASLPITFAVAASSLAVAALLACYLPARRAAKVDPLVALRHE